MYPGNLDTKQHESMYPPKKQAIRHIDQDWHGTHEAIPEGKERNNAEFKPWIQHLKQFGDVMFEGKS